MRNESDDEMSTVLRGKDTEERHESDDEIVSNEDFFSSSVDEDGESFAEKDDSDNSEELTSREY